MNIYVGVVNEYARLYIALGIDVEILPSACDTSSNEFTVVLEVHTEDRFRSAELTDLMIHFCTLFGCGQKFG